MLRAAPPWISLAVVVPTSNFASNWMTCFSGCSGEIGLVGLVSGIFSRKLGRNPFKSSGSADEPPSQTSSMSAKAKAAATATADKARRLSATASQKARDARHSMTGAKLDPSAPARVGFVGVSRDRKLVAHAQDDEDPRTKG